MTRCAPGFTWVRLFQSATAETATHKFFWHAPGKLPITGCVRRLNLAGWLGIVSFVASASLSCGGLPPTTTSPGTPCIGTGVSDRTATASIDIGDLTKASVDVSLHVGDVLFIGSNGCGAYSIPNSDTVGPVLMEMSRHQQAAPGVGDGAHTLDVRYKAIAPGSAVIQVKCRSDSCDGFSDPKSAVQVVVSVTA